MKTRKMRLTLAVLAVLVTAGIVTSAAARQGRPAQETGPVFNLEGAWYGMTSIPGIEPVPSLDTFTSNARNPGAEGSALCTVPAAGAVGGTMPNPLNPDGWLNVTPSAHGNWVRIGTNRYAATMVRSIFDENGNWFGWAKYWSTVTALSANEMTGTMNAQYYAADTPLFPQTVTGTLYRRRVEMIFEQ